MTAKRPTLPQLAQPDAGRAPLAGVRVVDFTRVLAGPFGTQILGDLGAEVIKIEAPGVGDDTRSMGRTEGFGAESPFFLSLNRSKRSVAIDLKSEAGRQVALDLIAKADILVENFTGPVMRKFQLDYPSLKDRFPTLIYCSVSGYGRVGRNADAGGFDSPVAADAGVLGLNAYEGMTPVLGALPYTDISTALNATIGILAALQARRTYGVGQHVDVAMFASALANLTFQGCEYLASGVEPTLNKTRGPAPRGIFDTADGRIVLTSNARMFKPFCESVMERPEWLADPRFATPEARQENGEAFLAEIEAVFLTRPSAVWSERCKAVRIPCGVLRSAGEALMSEEAQEAGLVFGLPHPTVGAAPAIAQPFRLSETPVRYGAPPLLGQHTQETLRDLLGYDQARIDELAQAGAIALGREPATSA